MLLKACNQVPSKHAFSTQKRSKMITGQETASRVHCAPVIGSFVVNVMCQSDSSTETASESDQFELSTEK